MNTTIHLPKRQQQQTPQRQQPAPAQPGAKAWRNLCGTAVVIRLKSGVTISGTVATVALGVMTLATDARLLERDATDWFTPVGKVHIDAASISFAIEGGE